MNEGSVDCMIALDSMACNSSEENVQFAASMVNPLNLGGDVRNLGPELWLDPGLEFVKSRAPMSVTRETDSTDEIEPSRSCDLELEAPDALR